MRKGRGGIYAAIAAIAGTVGLGVVGAAGANDAATHELTGQVNSGPWSPANDITIQTGDSVTWKFDTGSYHNVQSTGDNWTDPIPDDQPIPNHPPVTRTFAEPGVYTFVCEAHLGFMDGSITVQDEPGDPTPDPTTSATPSPTPSPQPSDPTTPDPGGGDDTVKPSVGKLRLKPMRRAVRVSFRLSEPATVTVTVKKRGSSKVLKSKRLQASAGTRSVTLRSKQLKRGRYTVEIRARDAYGNRSSLAKKTLSVK